MINTRIYDRAPLKDVRVKEPQVVRVRTPQILMSRTNEEYQKGDILDANTTAILIKNLHSPDIERLQEQIEEARRKLANAVTKESIGIPGGVASLDSTGNVPIDQLANISTDLFIVVSELPTEDIKEGKIYCIKDTSSTAQDNGYIEYAYINNKWEKIGQFQAKPDLSGYAKLNGNVKFETIRLTGGGYQIFASASSYLGRLEVYNLTRTNSQSPDLVFATDGSVFNVSTLLSKSDYQTDKTNLDTAIENANTAISTEQQERENADTQLRNDLNAEIARANRRENSLEDDIKEVDRQTRSMINYMGSQVSYNSINVNSIKDKITPKTELDLTSIDTADIGSLRSIVKALATELNTRGLIKLKSA